MVNNAQQTMTCQAVVQGPYSYLNWQVNGQDVSNRIGTTFVFQLPHLNAATYTLRYTACNEVEGAPAPKCLSAQLNFNVSGGP